MECRFVTSRGAVGWGGANCGTAVMKWRSLDSASWMDELNSGVASLLRLHSSVAAFVSLLLSVFMANHPDRTAGRCGVCQADGEVGEKCPVWQRRQSESPLRANPHSARRSGT